jgi:acetyltransferase-like isoleucine patch superfamily enzyme
VIGANSVVTHDIPEYSVAVGAPAKVIKRYNIPISQNGKLYKYKKYIKIHI